MRTCSSHPHRTPLRHALVSALLFLIAIAPGRAALVRVETLERAPFADGRVFGRTGAYERIVGRLHFEVAPDAPANARVADLTLAPRNAAGCVEFRADFFLLKPVDPGRGNGRLLFDVVNRGNKLALWTFNGARGNNPRTIADAGNAFLMREGYTVLWCGWSGEVPPSEDRLRAELPIARAPDGKPITGAVHVEICRDDPVPSSPLYWTPWTLAIPYPPATAGRNGARLTVRPTRFAPGKELPADAWALARDEAGRPVPDPTQLWVRGGLRPGMLYDLVYTARDPRVAGLGFVVVRDSVAFFRHERADRSGAPNPLAGAIRQATIFGISQSGRFINHFLYDGFNADERGRAVFDAALSHVSGAGRGLFNQRFGMATLAATQHEAVLSASESFPFTTVPETDPDTGRKGDLLERARASGTLPKIFFTQTSTEYWTRGASLVHTDVDGTRDVGLDPNVRLYAVAGAQHLGGGTTERGNYQNPGNPLDDRPFVLRALLLALDAWAGEGIDPPASRYPRIADGTLVDLQTYNQSFPPIQGLRLPKGYYAPPRLDFGAQWESRGIAERIPPAMGKPYQTLVPATDPDGNELAGIRLPDVAVPLATYTGWNLRAAPHGAQDMLAPYTGSYLPFARTRDERLAAQDPRLSIHERYPTRDSYLTRYAEAALDLRDARFLLDEDAVALLKTARARRFWDR